MGFTIREQAIINDNFKELIRGGNYEKLIEQLMNDSQKIFPNKYKHLEKQSKGECDFIDLSTNQKYDAKLLFSGKDGKLVGSRNSDFGEWMQIKLDEVAEFSEYIEKRGQFDIENLTIYKIFKDRLATVAPDEYPIIFIPYPVVLDGEGLDILHFCGDLLSAIFTELKKKNLVKERKLYVIYPCVENALVIRCLNNSQREFFSDHELRKYIAYDVSLVSDEQD